MSILKPLAKAIDVGTPWSPVQLFSGGEEGSFYLPLPDYLYTDSARTTLISDPGDPVGGMKDLSGNGNHATQSNDPDRPIYGITPATGRRNELDSTDSLATQDVEVTNEQRTLSFVGDGSITLSGTHSETLNGVDGSTRVSTTFTPSAGTLTVTVSGTVEDAQLELGDSVTAYQSVVSEFEVTEAGVRSLHALFGNGTNQYMTIPTSGLFDTTKSQITVSGNVLDDGGSFPIIFGSVTSGVYQHRYRSDSGRPETTVTANGIVVQATGSSGFGFAHTVLASKYDRSSGDASVRWNGGNDVVDNITPADIDNPGTTFEILRGNGDDARLFPGQFFGMVHVSDDLTQQQLERLEKYIAHLSGVDL